MKHEFTYELTSEILAEIQFFCQELSEFSIFQNPVLLRALYPDRKICLCTCRSKGHLVAYALIAERHRRASVFLGPVVKNDSYFSSIVLAIAAHYHKKNYGELIVQPPLLENDSHIEKIALGKFKIIQGNQYFNWATLIVELGKEDGEIAAQFRENHRRSIKKSLDLGMKVEPIESRAGALQLATLHDRMYQMKGLKKEVDQTKKVYSDLLTIFQNEPNLGFFLGVYLDKELIGGVVNLCSGNSCCYKFGISDQTQKKFPVLHLGIYESMKEAKKRGFNYYDLWGYSKVGENEDQLARINHFKLGFTKNIVDYPLSMHLMLNPFVNALLQSALYLRKAFQSKNSGN
ncbi:MAG: GNAT family N-acetyltransferase [Vicingaceae bacterium]